MTIPKPLVQINQMFIVISVLAGLLLAKPFILLPFVIGMITLSTKQNPVIQFSKRFLKKPLNEYIQEDKQQQLFNQWIATICLGISFVAFTFSYSIVGYFFSVMVIAAAGLALSGYCIGCTIRYRFLMWKHQHHISTK
jgi:uncharacterized membrane protein